MNHDCRRVWAASIDRMRGFQVRMVADPRVTLRLKNVEDFAGDDTGMDFYIVARDHSARASGGDTARDRRTRILRSRA